MMNKDFENFELRLKTIREDSLESFDAAEKIFEDTYKNKLEEIFPRDILGAKKYIAGTFTLNYVEHIHAGTELNIQNIFKNAVEKVVSTLPLSPDKQNSLKENILKIWELSESLSAYLAVKDDISRDPFFALIEDFSIDWDISQEEFLLLQQGYESKWDFLKALELLPESIRTMFHSHIEMTLSHEHSSKKAEFTSEYAQELQDLEKKGINIEPVVVYVSRSYYKTPGKIKKYEHPKRRMRRTFKIALLKLLRAKLWNIDASIMLEKFEAGESFEDFFSLLFKLLEVVNEDPNWEEIYSILKLEEEVQDEVFTAEENKEKILAGESLVMKIASLFSKGSPKDDEKELEDGLLDKILDVSTDIVWEDIYFNRQDENAGIYNDSVEDEESSDDVDYDSMSPETAWELLQHEFHKVEEEKRKAFLEGQYDDIDIFNESLLSIESKLHKLSKILHIET